MVYELAASSWGPEEVDALNQVIAGDRFTMGARVAELEQRFAATFG